MKKNRTILSLAMIALFALTACEQGTSAKVDAPTKADLDRTEAPKAGANKAGATKDAKSPAKSKSNNFAVTTDAVNLTVGADGKANVSIKPAAGYKINKDYPWKASIVDASDLDCATKDFAKDAWTLSEKDAALSVPLKANKAGDHTVKAKINFGVCNESRCDVVRDHEVTWKVAAK